MARAWDDDSFRQRLLAEPEDVLREEGFDLPEGVEVRVVEEEGKELPEGVTYLRLPVRPATGDLIEDELSLPEHWPIGPFNGCGCITCLCSCACSDCQCPCKHSKKCIHKCH